MEIPKLNVQVLCIVAATMLTYARGQDAVCRTPLGDTGTCVSLKRCPEIANFFQKLSLELAKQYATDLQKACANQKSIDRFPMLCCVNAVPGNPITSITPKWTTTPRRPSPTATTTVRPRTTSSAPRPPLSDADHRLPTEEDRCGISKIRNKIIGGEEAEPHSWPWMALVGYNPHAVNTFRCGGTLLTTRHVLTAAHCLKEDLSFVRLGEHDLRSIDAPNRVDINVAKMIGHPNYDPKTGRNDIGLLVLERKVQFTEYIYPVCTPFSKYLRDKTYLYKNPYVAGWGRTNLTEAEGSPVLKQLQITIVGNDQCRTVYKASNRLYSDDQFDESVFCAKYAGSDDAGDTCQGDSGGPLMMPELYKGIVRYYVVGIVSYGIGCAENGVPSIYTKLQYFRDWVNQQVAVS